MAMGVGVATGTTTGMAEWGAPSGFDFPPILSLNLMAMTAKMEMMMDGR